MTNLIKESSNPSKKYMVKVIKDDKTHLIHFGAKNYKDYTIYYKEEGKEEADKKKNAYIARHKVNENFNDPLTPAFWAVHVLWSKPTVSASLRDTIKRFNLKLEPFDN